MNHKDIIEGTVEVFADPTMTIDTTSSNTTTTTGKVILSKNLKVKLFNQQDNE